MSSEQRIGLPQGRERTQRWRDAAVSWAGVLHGGDEFLIAAVCLVALDDEEGVDDGGNPEGEEQEEIDDGLEGFPAKENGQRRQEDGDEVTHGD